MLAVTSATYGHTAHIQAHDRKWAVSITTPGKAKNAIDEGATSPRNRAPMNWPIERLTAREWQVLEHLVAGAPNREIATNLGISARTVESHLSTIYGKLGVRGRSEALLWGIDVGLQREKAS